MFWRNALLALIISIYLTIPLHSPVISAHPCYKLAKGVMALGAENILYQRSFFIAATETKEAQLFSQLEKVAAEVEPGAEWYLSPGLEDSYAVLQVCGSDYRSFRLLCESLCGLLNEEDIWGQVCQLECRLPAGEGDLRTPGLDLVKSLDGELHCIQDYNGAVHLLAYVPWCAEQFILEDEPVNLNLELNLDAERDSVRLRAGIPVLLTLSHYQEIEPLP